jgi:hypothetical protein
MSSVRQLIREVDRMIDSGIVSVHEWRAIKAKYADKPTKRIPAKREKPRAFKEIVRLHGSALTNLRKQRYEIDKGLCQDKDCGVWVPLDGPLTVRAHLAHVRNKRMYGDTLENTRIKCYHCHIELEHQKGIK